MGKSIVEQTKDEVKKSKQRKLEKENKSMKKPIIVTVILTLVSVASLIGMFLFGAMYNQSVNDRVHSEAKALSLAQPSKQ